MKYDEFKDLKLIEDKANPFCSLYELEDGSRFYIEPVFYTMLKGLKIIILNYINQSSMKLFLEREKKKEWFILVTMNVH